MAAKKKTFKRPAKKAVRKRLSRAAAPLAPAPAPAGRPEARRGGLAPFIVLALVAAGLYFIFRKDEPAPAHKVSAGAQIEALPTQAPAAAPTPPHKRSTSAAGPRVWNRKGLVRFYVLREKGAAAEVRIFKAGNIPVCLLSSDKGPRQTVELRWDGKDAAGALVKAGTYYARISGAHGDMVEEILVK